MMTVHRVLVKGYREYTRPEYIDSTTFDYKATTSAGNAAQQAASK